MKNRPEKTFLVGPLARPSYPRSGTSSGLMNCGFFKYAETPREDFLTRASCPAQLPSERYFFWSDELWIL